MTDRYPLGFNINAGALRNWDSLIASCKLLNSSHQMIMITASSNPRNDVDGIIRLHQAIGDPTLQWMIRVFSGKEGNWKDFNVDEYVRYCTEVHRHFPNVIFDAPSNEPGVPENEVEAFIDNQVELIEKFAAKGIRYAATCYGMGSPHHEHITNGRYDKLIRTLAKYDTAYLSLHEYAMGWLEAGSGYSYDILLDPANLSSYWRTKWAVQEGHYLIRRSDYWAMRADALGIRRPRVFLTECPFDQNPDGVTQLNNRHNGIWDKVRNQYGLQKYNYDLRGLNSYEKYWKATYPNLTYDEALAKLLIHFVDDCMYVDYIVAGFMFAWNQDWDLPEGTDISIPERRPTIQILSNHAKTYVKSGTTPTPPPPPDPIPDPIPAPEYVTLAIWGYDSTPTEDKPVNARVRISPNGTVIGTLAAKPAITPAKVSTAPAAALDGYQWVEVILFPDTDKMLHGFIAKHVFTQAVAAPVEDPRIPLLLALVKTLLAALKTVRQRRVDEVGDNTSEILYIDEVIGQAEAA